MYKITKQGMSQDGTYFWVMESVDRIEESIDPNIEYLDIPSDKEGEKFWYERIVSILPKLEK